MKSLEAKLIQNDKMINYISGKLNVAQVTFHGEDADPFWDGDKLEGIGGYFHIKDIKNLEDGEILVAVLATMKEKEYCVLVENITIDKKTLSCFGTEDNWTYCVDFDNAILTKTDVRKYNEWVLEK